MKTKLLQMSKNKFVLYLALLVSLFSATIVNGATITSTAAGGAWTASTTWVGGAVPLATDAVVIATTGAGSVTTSTGTITCAGLTINSGAILTMRRPFIVNGATSINGRINFGSTSTTVRAMTFNGSVTLNSGAVWDETNGGTNTVLDTFTFGGSFTNNAATFTALAGLHTFNVAGTLSGSTVTAIPNTTFSTANYINSGLLSVSTTLTVTGAAISLTNNGTINTGTALSGTGSLIQGASGILNIGGTSGITSLNATAVGNTVNYTGAAQTIKATSYHHLGFTGSGAKSIATGTSVAGNLSITGATASVGAGLNISVGSLTLGGLNKVNGTWGSTSSIATYTDNTYFAPTTGYLTVTTDTRPMPVFSGITASQSICFGTATVTLSGAVIAFGPVYPANGETVGISINGNTQNASIAGGAGAFSINFPTNAIPASGIPYIITYNYTGDVNLQPAANNTSTTLTINEIPIAPTVTVVDNCDGTSTLTASNYSGTLLWSTLETTPSIIVSLAGTYTITQTVNGCTSLPGSGTAAPKTTPSSPTITVVDNCDGTSTLTASDYSGTLLWSTFETTPSIIVSLAGAYTVTQTVDGCTSLPGSGTAAPKTTPVATITGPTTTCKLAPGNNYYTEPGMSNYVWTVSGGIITDDGTSTSHNAIVKWISAGTNSISVSYTSDNECTSTPFVLDVTTNVCDPETVDPFTIPQFVDPLPHFAGLRVDAKAGGDLIVKAVPHQQVALSTGTMLVNGTIGTDPGAGLGNFWTYSTSKDNGVTWTPPLWPGVTVEAQRGNPLNVKYRNDLFGQTYADVNLVVDQTIHWAMPEMTADPYSGPVPIVTHLHGGEVASESDGGPYAWYTPGYALTGPTWGIDGVDSVYHYPNTQEAATIWFHDHAMGATRLNVYAGLAAFYFLRGPDEENDQLPGWSSDDLVKEVAPEGTSGTFNPDPYLPEIEIAIQDRMFNDRGGLYWPVNPTNSDVHPFWTPEFFGDVMTVNGKSWPYLSVAPRKYRFHMLDGCNARFLNMWITSDPVSRVPDGPVIQIIGADGGLLDSPVVLDPATGGRLFMAPGERFDVVIDFSTVTPGTIWTLVNDANIPYPSGDAVDPQLDGRIMQFVVNGEMRSAANPDNPGNDASNLPATLRATNLVKLADSPLPPAKKRQLTLNEHQGPGGPLEVLVNNSKYDNNGMGGMTGEFGDLTEIPTEGTTELWQIVNLTMDAHPMHLHLVQFQLVSRQALSESYMEAYDAAFSDGMFMPAAGPPAPYDVLNSDGAVGGNPSITAYLTGPVNGPLPEEQGWKDTYKCYPGEVTTFLVRYAPTDLPVTTPPENLLFGFDPSKGPGYVWHCHIVDHEDNEMMRPTWIEPSPMRAQHVCLYSSGNVYTAPAGKNNYIWTVSPGGTITAGGTTEDNTATVTWNTPGPQWVKAYFSSGTNALTIPAYFLVIVDACSNQLVSLKVFLQGPYSGSGQMNTTIHDLLPSSQPYNDAPWNYFGAESVSSMPADVVDWVLVELRDAQNAASAISATRISIKAALLLNDGRIVGLDGTSMLQINNTISQQLFVVIWHRNHLGILSANALTPNPEGFYTYDFSTSASQAYAGDQNQLGDGIFGMIGGDSNADGIINEPDYMLIWRPQAGKTDYLYGDKNMDGQVNNKDKNDLWYPNQGYYSHVPE